MVYTPMTFHAAAIIGTNNVLRHAKILNWFSSGIDSHFSSLNVPLASHFLQVATEAFSGGLRDVICPTSSGSALNLSSFPGRCPVG